MDDLRKRVSDLSATQRGLLAQRLEAIVSAGDAGRAEDRSALWAHVEAKRGVEVDELRRHLRTLLPEYMVPSSIVVLESLPRLASGKVDRRALSFAPSASMEDRAGPRPGPAAEDAGARGEIEKCLERIWAEVLGLESVHRDENFFELGGDSILSIRVIARANQAGLRVPPRTFFENPTIAHLVAHLEAAPADAAAAVPETAAVSAPPVQEATHGSDPGSAGGRIEGADPGTPIPLTPIQRWFFEHTPLDPAHWNQAVLLEVPASWTPQSIEKALDVLVASHDALRLGFRRGESGWRQELSAPVSVSLEIVDVSALLPADREVTIRAVEDRLHRSVSLERPPLLRAALLPSSGVGGAGILVLVLHHLVVDGVSWSLLLEDLDVLCRQAETGRPSVLPDRGASFREWAEWNVRRALDPRLESERSYWAFQARAPGGLPIDGAGGPNTRGTAETVAVRLDEAETASFLRELPKSFRTQANDALLSALALAVAEWTGDSLIQIGLEGHGRHAEGLDLSRTVGWFTSYHPLVLSIDPGREPEATLKAIKEQLRAVPAHGTGYGVLRYLGANDRGRDDLAAEPEIQFNYLGQRERGDGEGSGRNGARLLRDAGPSSRSGRELRPALLEIDCLVDDGIFTANWTYSPAVHRRATIERLAGRFLEHLRGLLNLARSGASGATPSDFPLAGLDQGELDRIAGLLSDPEDGA